MGRYMLDAAVCNHKGNRRTNNEDSFYLTGRMMALRNMDKGGTFVAGRKGGVQLYAVCDGMGGINNGERASFQAVQALSFFHEGLGKTVDDEQLIALVHHISQAVRDQAQMEGEKSGTTLTLCVWQDDTMRCLHVGDSRIYAMHEGQLYQVTRDHSEIQRLIDVGLVSPEEARTDSRRHMILQYLGMDNSEGGLEPSLTAPIACQEGDWFLLCSDGLCDMVEDPYIEAVLQRSQNAKQAVEALVQLALQNGGVDNVTVMALRVTRPEDNEMTPTEPVDGKRVRRTDAAAVPVVQKVLSAARAVTAAGAMVMLIELLYRLLA